MSKVRLFFPDIETGQASVGYSTIDIANHVAEIDGVEAEAIAYWQQTAGASILEIASSGVQPTITTFDIIPPEDSDDDELLIGAQR